LQQQAEENKVILAELEIQNREAKETRVFLFYIYLAKNLN